MTDGVLLCAADKRGHAGHIFNYLPLCHNSVQYHANQVNILLSTESEI